MAGFSLDSALFEEWLVVQREELHRGALDVLRDLVGYHEAQGAYEGAVVYGRHQIELEGWREEAHRQVMRGLVLGGDRAGALAQYEACRRALEEALGVEPQAETRALYERIRAGEELQPQSALPPHNLPAYLTPFVGREACLTEIADRLADPDCRLLTLVGPGGIGKTRLAVEAARAQLEQYEDGVFFVPLAAVQSTEGIVPAVAQAIGFSFYSVIEGGEDAEPKQQLLDYLRRRRMLLVLDNYEHLLEGADLATEVLRAAPGVRIVTTTRTRLNVRGERLLPVGGMRYPETLPEAASEVDRSTRSVRDAARYSAVQLFMTRAREMRPDFRPLTDDLAHVAHICCLMQGMPLAILLAAAWVGMLTPAEIASEIVQAIDFLAADWRDAPERQRSMRAVFDHSWRLLSEREREVLQGLSVFRGGFTRQAAQHVTGASLRELMALADRSLLHRAQAPSTALRTGGQYELRELLRLYAEEKLGQFPDREEAVRDRHSAYYAAALQQWEIDLKGPRQQMALAEMDAEIENVRAAWGWAVERDQIGRLGQAVGALSGFYQWRLRLEEGASAFRVAAQRLSALVSGSPTTSADGVRVLARVLSVQGLLVEREMNEQLQRQSLALLEELELTGQDTRSEKASILLALGGLCDPDQGGGDPEEAERMYVQSGALYQALGDRWGGARALGGLAAVAWNSGDYDRARRLLEECLIASRVVDSPTRTCHMLRFLGYVHLHQGQLDEGERMMRESLALAQEVGDRRAIAGEHRNVGIALCYQGRYVEASLLLKRSLMLFKDLSDRWVAAANNDLGKAALHLGQYERARSLGEKGLTLAQEISVRRLGFCYLLLGNVALAKEKYGEAYRLLRKGVAVCREIGNRNDLGLTLAVWRAPSVGWGNRARHGSSCARRCA